MSNEGGQRTAPTSKVALSEFGWVSTDGNQYACGKHDHGLLARQFNTTERHLEQAGWIKISKSVNHIYVFSRVEPTSEQIATLYDWAVTYRHMNEYFSYVKMWEGFES